MIIRTVVNMDASKGKTRSLFSFLGLRTIFSTTFFSFFLYFLEVRDFKTSSCLSLPECLSYFTLSLTAESSDEESPTLEVNQHNLKM